MLILALVAEAPVDRFDIGCQIRLPGSIWRNATRRPCPRQHRLAAELQAVLGAQHTWQAWPHCREIERTCDGEAYEGACRDDRHGVLYGSSTMAKHFSTRPFAVRSKTKSADHTSLGAVGVTNPWRSAVGTFLRRRRRICSRSYT